MPTRPLLPHRRLTLVALVTDAVLDAAYAWLCRQRTDWPVDADVWRFRQRWPEEKVRLREELLAGGYEVGLLSRVTLQHGEEVDLWSARDAVVMKALALVIPSYLPLSPAVPISRVMAGSNMRCGRCWRPCPSIASS